MTQEEIDNMKAKLAANSAAALAAAATAASVAATTAEQAAALEVPVAKPVSLDEFSGTLGGPFAMYGSFGSVPGAVTLNGRLMTLTAWRERSIKGQIPADLQPGPVEIAINSVVVGTGKL